MRHSIIVSGLAALLALAAQAQTNSTLEYTPGDVVVLRGGDGIITIASGRQHPIFIDEFAPNVANQAGPVVSLELPTNGANAIMCNAHAGSEGQYMTRSADRTKLVVASYCGDLNSIPGTPSSATNSGGQGYPRGFGVVDAYTNWNVTYSSADWFGLQPGITQNNPRGIATDGTNDFWGCGTIAGTQSGGFTETGTLFWNNAVSPDPELVQNAVNSAYFMRIVNDVLYMVCQTDAGGALNNGVYNFAQYSFAGGAPVPLPWIPGGVQDVVTTNLFLNVGNTYTKTVTFDMNTAGTIAYTADEAYGIVKWVNSGGGWSSPYLFNSNNIGSGVGSLVPAASFPKNQTGCYGIAVDFSGANPIIYATTMDAGDGGKNTCSNRLISIVDSGEPAGYPTSTAIVATTLTTAMSTNEVLRGVDFAPNLLPAIITQPSPVSITINESASLSAGIQSAYPVTYQWQSNSINVTNVAGLVSGATANPLNIMNATTNLSANYTLIVSNYFGAVTSAVANVYVSPTADPPTLGPSVNVADYIGATAVLSVTPGGTPPFTYQWYFEPSNSTTTIELVDDGITYYGSATSTLYVSNLVQTNGGNFYLIVDNQTDEPISNEVAVLTVAYLPPSIPSEGEPTPAIVLQGQTATLSVSDVAGTPTLNYEWYQGSPSSPVTITGGEFTGINSSTLTITGATSIDAVNYFCTVNNSGGSVNSSVVSVTVITPPALSYVPYNSINQIYTQNFDSLPDPGSTAVNTVGGGGLTTIGGITYLIANPFDFAYPLYNNLTDIPSGGLNLAATMSGWYGECDGDTAADGAQLGAADGTTTTGGIYSFGTLTNDPANLSLGNTNNRALGLIATSTSAGTHFGLKLINNTGVDLNYISLQYIGEFWKTGSKPKTMVFSYNIDPAGNSSTLNAAEILAASNNPVSALNVTFPTAGVVGGTNGLLPQNQIFPSVANLALASPWQSGNALWLVWSIYDATGSGQGYGIDDLKFAASSTANVNLDPQHSKPVLTNLVYSSSGGFTFNFTNVPGVSSEFTVWYSANLATPTNEWTNLGPPSETPGWGTGVYQFTDPNAAGNSPRFYFVTSP